MAETNMFNVRVWFDLMIEQNGNDYPSFREYLSENADIVKCKPFEKAITKIMKGNAHLLTVAEAASVRDLHVPV